MWAICTSCTGSSLQHNLDVTAKDVPVGLDSWALTRSLDRELGAVWTILKLVARDSPTHRGALRKVNEVLVGVQSCLGGAVRYMLLAIVFLHDASFILRLVGSQSEKVCATTEGMAASASAATLV